MFDDFKKKKDRRFAAPTDELRKELIHSLHGAHALAARYRNPQQTALMRELMTQLYPAFNYFSVYVQMNQINLNSGKDVMDKAEAYYEDKRVKITPREATRLVRTLTMLGFNSGLYNVHRLQSPDEEGV